jgi:hypothetical protein
MLGYSELVVAIAAAPRITVHGLWSRCIEYALLQGPPPGRPPGSPAEPLWAGGAVITGGRFTPVGSFSTLYLASDHITAQVAPTQELGRAAYDSGVITTLKYPSSKQPGGWGLAIFVDRLTINSVNYIEVIDKSRKLKTRLP